jgi:protein-disulfide isomerase
MFHEENRSRSEGGLTLSPKGSFILGLVAGVLVLCTIGFFVLLGIVLKGNVSVAGSREGGSPSAAAPSPSAPSAAPSLPTEDVVGEVKPISADDHVLGDKNAKVILYEWSDFQCPFCQRFHPSMKQLMEEYKGRVKWVYRHFPLSFHPQATPSANAAECAAEQGKFWEYSDKLFENQATLGDALYKQLAADLKLNAKKFDDCYAAKKYNSKITQQMTDGSTAGVTGTPGTIIVGADGSKQLVPGAVPYEQLKGMVDSAL